MSSVGKEGRKFRQIYRASRHLESERVLYVTRLSKGGKKGKKNHLRVLLYLKRKQNLPSVSWQFPQEASLALLHHSSTPSAPIVAPHPPPIYIYNCVSSAGYRCLHLMLLCLVWVLFLERQDLERLLEV